MIEFIDSDDWDKLDFPLKESVFFKSDFLNAISSSFGYQLHYLIGKENNNLLVAAALFSYKRDIVPPLVFTYSSIWFDENISDRKYISVFLNFINFIKSNWKQITFRLPLSITDIRPFIWKGFVIENRYTYVKKCGTPVHKSVVKNVKKAEKSNLKCVVRKATYSEIEESLNSLEDQMFGLKSAKLYKYFFVQLNENLISFNAYKNDFLISTNLILLDKSQKKSYALIITKCEDKKAHTFLYKKEDEWSLENNIDYIDFCGANTEGLAEFKSYFQGELKPYFIVSYNPMSSFLRKRVSDIKIFVKKIIK